VRPARVRQGELLLVLDGYHLIDAQQVRAQGRRRAYPH